MLDGECNNPDCNQFYWIIILCLTGRNSGGNMSTLWIQSDRFLTHLPTTFNWVFDNISWIQYGIYFYSIATWPFPSDFWQI